MPEISLNNFKYLLNKQDINTLNRDDIIKMVSKEPKLLRNLSVDNYSEDIVMAAVKVSPSVIKYSKIQYFNVCVEAVKNNPDVIKYCRKFNKLEHDKICVEAVKIRGTALQYIENQTYEIQLEAIKNDYTALQYIRYPHKQIYFKAIKMNPMSILFIKDISDELYTKTLDIIFSNSYDMAKRDIINILSHMPVYILKKYLNKS